MKSINYKYQDKHKINVYLDKQILKEIRTYHKKSGVKLIKLYNDIIKRGWSDYKRSFDVFKE